MKLPKMLNHYTRLPKSIYILFFARMVNSMGAFVYPFLTIYLTKTLSLLIPRILILSAFFYGAAQPASTAMTTDLTNPSNRKAAFSLLYLGNNIGFAVGPLIAGFLYNNYLMWIFFSINVFSIFQRKEEETV